MVHDTVNTGIDTLTYYHTSSGGDKRGSTDNHYKNWLNDMRIDFYEEADYGSDINWSAVGSGVNVETTFPGTPSKGVIFRRKNTNGNSGKVRDYTYDGNNWVKVEYDSLLDYFIEVARGNIAGHTAFKGYGERENVQVTAQGEDVWRGTATTVPTPADAGEDMFIVSDDDEDGAAGNTGILTVRIHYLDASGDEQSVDRTMAGTTPVAISGLNIRFIQSTHALTVGSNGVAVGNITIYKSGASSTIYSIIEIGGNKSLLTNRMVPNGKTLYVTSWHGTVVGKTAQDQQIALRLRSTDHDGVIFPGVFLFKDTMYLKLGGMAVTLNCRIKIPQLSIIKVSAWGDVANAECSAYWDGILIDN